MPRAEPWHAWYWCGKPPRWKHICVGISESHALRLLRLAKPLARDERVCVSQEMPEHVPELRRGRPRTEVAQ
jgi:hypothetical protein